MVFGSTALVGKDHEWWTCPPEALVNREAPQCIVPCGRCFWKDAVHRHTLGTGFWTGKHGEKPMKRNVMAARATEGIQYIEVVNISLAVDHRT